MERRVRRMNLKKLVTAAVSLSLISSFSAISFPCVVMRYSFFRPALSPKGAIQPFSCNEFNAPYKDILPFPWSCHTLSTVLFPHTHHIRSMRLVRTDHLFRKNRKSVPDSPIIFPHILLPVSSGKTQVHRRKNSLADSPQTGRKAMAHQSGLLQSGIIKKRNLSPVDMLPVK